MICIHFGKDDVNKMIGQLKKIPSNWRFLTWRLGVPACYEFIRWPGENKRAGSGDPARRGMCSMLRELQAFADDVFHEIDDAVAVTPFVVVPADKLEELAVQFKA